MNEKDARDIVSTKKPKDGNGYPYAKGYIEALEKAKVLVRWIESLGSVPTKDILDWWKGEK